MPTATAELSDAMIETYRRTGHLTWSGVFTEGQMDAAIEDAKAWGIDLLDSMDEKKRQWYMERNMGPPVLRKLDNPVAHRAAFRQLAAEPALVRAVEQIIGRGVTVMFSQIFFKPPEGGGPKPVHQDNFYFGAEDPEGVITAWIALDEATVENGCLYFGDGTNLGPVYPHVAPPDEPFNLRVPADVAAKTAMTPAPVPRGGVSFHHGHTFHQSSANHSTRWRRAAAIHYIRNDVKITRPALPYDPIVFVRISR